MAGQKFGKSLYYATDKNIYDALNEHKVDSATVVELFEVRNTLVSRAAPRKWLAEYFSRLNHDYYDHKNIAARLGVVPRRERITSMDVSGIPSFEDLVKATETIKEALEQHGDVVTINRTKEKLTVQVQYSTVDFRRSEFNQVQVRDGELEFQREADDFVVRNTQNVYVNSVRDLILGVVATDVPEGITKTVVSLYATTEPQVRSSFFYDLMDGLPGYILRDVTDVYVFQAGKEFNEDDNAEESYVERVSLRGRGVTHSEYLTDLAKDGYYIVKVGWRCREQFGKGSEFAVEALFANPADCTGFSYILLGVYDNVDGKVMAQRRTPTKVEIAIMSRAIEARARTLVGAILSASADKSGD